MYMHLYNARQLLVCDYMVAVVHSTCVEYLRA